MNRYLIQKDRERIENYIERRGLPMKESPSGFGIILKMKDTELFS